MCQFRWENSTAQLELVEKSENCHVFMRGAENPTLSAIISTTCR
jgi:hypothetical protein